MSYTNLAEMVDRFGQRELEQLTDKAAGNSIDPLVLGRALADADAEIDARLAVRYALPLASVPLVLARVAADIARYHLWADAASEAVRTRYKDALKLLDQIAAGQVDLPAAQPLASAAGAVTVQGRSPASQFAAGQNQAFRGGL